MNDKLKDQLIFFIPKRIMDVLMAIIFFIVFSPVFIIVGFLIWKEDHHSPIYSHIRIGKDGKKFKFYKFRSMRVDADDLLFSNPQMLSQIRSGSNKIVKDPRVTRIGKFIRKYSIDEFLQAWNILRGEMSFIGPRALRPDEWENYASRSSQNSEKLKIMNSVHPGITGLWQVSGRSNIDFDKRMDLDCYYAKKKSLFLDLLILIKTPMAILRADGAY